MPRHRPRDAISASLHAKLAAITGTWKRDAERSRQFVEAVVHVLCAGVAWEDLPERFGKPNSLYRRYRRWAVAGIWDVPFMAGVPEDALETVMVDATITEAQRFASGAKGWWRGGFRPVVRRAHHQHRQSRSSVAFTLITIQLCPWTLRSDRGQRWPRPSPAAMPPECLKPTRGHRGRTATVIGRARRIATASRTSHRVDAIAKDRLKMTDWSVISLRMSRLPRRRKETRAAELLEAALDVFAEKGFAAARMEDIAARAGVAKGTVYLYFPSKEAVFEALVRSVVIPNIARAERLAAEHDGPVAGLLRRLVVMVGALIRDTHLPCCRDC